MNVPEGLKYTKEHEWAQQENDLVICGITDYAQDALGDIVFLELPQVGDTFSSGDVFGVVESVKAVSDLYMPLGGEIVEINEALSEAPETVNSDPYQGGWMIKIKPADTQEIEGLMNADAYTAYCAEEAG